MRKAAFGLLMAGALVVAGCSSANTAEEKTDKVASNKKQVTEETSYEQIDPKLDEKLLSNKVTLYEAPKVKTPAVHKDAEKVIQDLAKQKKVDVKANLKDAQYRDFVYSAASDIGSLQKEQQKKVAEFVKYVDQFENEAKNKRIQELMAKVKAGKKLLGKERAELESLLPIQGGLKIEDLEPQTQQEAPQQTNPEGNTEQTTEPTNEQTTQPNEETQQQPSMTIGGDEQPSGTEQEETQPPTTDEGATEDDNTATEEPVTEEPGGLLGGDSPNTSGYDPKKAKEYAYKWWNKRNNEQYGYYSRVTNSYDDWYDCTNFVSQALIAGGIQEKRDSANNLYWYYSDEKPSYAWGIANSLYKHFKDRKIKQVRGLFDLEVGDVVNADFDHDGDIEHSALITKVTHNEVFITQHTSDKKDAPLSPWFAAGYDVYGWKMQTTK